MEIYIAPPEGKPDAALTRTTVIEALGNAGVVVEGQEERNVPGGERLFWSLRFAGSDAQLVLQEAGGLLVFGTLEQSMFDASSVPAVVCTALVGLGWEVIEDDVG